VRSGADVSGNLRKALCMGGVFAVSTVLHEKVRRIANHLGSMNSYGTGGVLKRSLQVLGRFLVLSVLI